MKKSKHPAFSISELILLFFHTCCFLAALYGTLNGYPLLCLLCILLLGLEIPFFLLHHAQSESNVVTKAEGEEESEAVQTEVLPKSTPDSNHKSKNVSDSVAVAPVSVKDEPAVTAFHFPDPAGSAVSVLPSLDTEPAAVINLVPFCESILQEFTTRYRLFPSQVQLASDKKSILLTTRKTLLTLIFSNLLDNAFKYVRADIQNAAHFTLTLSESESDVLLIFRNSTRGVAQDEIPFLTQLNYQGKNRLNGTGLGLFQTKAAVKVLHGSLWFKSSPATGFAAYLQLPLLTDMTASLTKEEGSHETA